MINIERKHLEPRELKEAQAHAIAQKQRNPKYNLDKDKYRTPEIVELICEDFHNKCYLCEEKASSSINVEHFKAHKDDPTLCFKWNNLFYACGHCNNIKLANENHNNILDCTKRTPIITDVIGFDTLPVLKSNIRIKAVTSNPSAEITNTVALLDLIYNGTYTGIKSRECENLSKKVHVEMISFVSEINIYYDEEAEEEEREEARKSIQRKLQKKSAFLAFKIWMIKTNERYLADFSHLLPPF